MPKNISKTKTTVSVVALICAGLWSLGAWAGKDDITGSAPQAKKQVTHIPSTISNEAVGGLNFFNSIGKKLTIEFDLNDHEGIKSANQQKINELKSMNNDNIMKQYNPTIVKAQMGGVNVLDITPKDWNDKKNARVLVFLHGGGYVFYDAESYIAGVAPLAQDLNSRVISVDYTTAPFANYEQVTDQVISVVKALNAEGYSMDNIGFYGDSAGGGLAAATALKMRDQGMKVPAALALWSPWLDVTRAGDTKFTLDEHEPVLDQAMLDKCALAYAPKEKHTHPYVSPVYADFSEGDFPPTLVQGGTKEIFLSDFVRFSRNIKKSAGERLKKGLAPLSVDLDIYEGMSHVFHIFLSHTPEAKDALQATKLFFEKHVSPIFSSKEKKNS